MNKDIYREIIDTEKISGFFWIYKWTEKWHPSKFKICPKKREISHTEIIRY